MSHINDDISELIGRIDNKDIFKYQKDRDWAKKVAKKFRIASKEYIKFMKYIEKTPAYKIFIEK